MNFPLDVLITNIAIVCELSGEDLAARSQGDLAKLWGKGGESYVHLAPPFVHEQNPAFGGSLNAFTGKKERMVTAV